jgi:hypothetical protein
VPDVAEPQAGGPVDVLVAVDVPDASVLTPHEHERRARMTDDRVRVKHVALIESLVVDDRLRRRRTGRLSTRINHLDLV